MGKYGFGDEPDEAETPAELPAITLPKPKPKAAAKPAPEIVQEAARAGEKLGFVSREPGPSPRGRKRVRGAEPQDKLLITGPARVVQQFRDYCDREDMPSYWSALERLMIEASHAGGRRRQ